MFPVVFLAIRTRISSIAFCHAFIGGPIDEESLLDGRNTLVIVCSLLHAFFQFPRKAVSAAIDKGREKILPQKIFPTIALRIIVTVFNALVGIPIDVILKC